MIDRNLIKIPYVIIIDFIGLKMIGFEIRIESYRFILNKTILYIYI